jgi:transcriptional regulator with XRE-family HTH domain
MLKQGKQWRRDGPRESGARKPSFENLRRVADKLDVSVDYLMGRVGEPGEAMPDELASYATPSTFCRCWRSGGLRAARSR